MSDKPTENKDEWLTRKEAARHLTELGYPLTYHYLRNLGNTKNHGLGPPFRRFGWKTVRYRKADLEKWARERTEDIR